MCPLKTSIQLLQDWLIINVANIKSKFYRRFVVLLVIVLFFFNNYQVNVLQEKMNFMKKENERLRKSLSHMVDEYDVLEARVNAIRCLKPHIIDQRGNADLGLSPVGARDSSHKVSWKYLSYYGLNTENYLMITKDISYYDFHSRFM